MPSAIALLYIIFAATATNVRIHYHFTAENDLFEVAQRYRRRKNRLYMYVDGVFAMQRSCQFDLTNIEHLS